MRKGIVITTSEYTKDFLRDCVKSLVPCKYNILIVCNNGYFPGMEFGAYVSELGLKSSIIVVPWNGFELAGIEKGAEFFDEFVYIPDSVIIKDSSIFDEIFAAPGGLMLSPNFLSYIGKYDSKVIEKIGVPTAFNKQQAVDYEFIWTRDYMKADKNLKKFWKMLPSDTFHFEEKYGRKNMVNECSWAVKYKGCWSPEQIK